MTQTQQEKLQAIKSDWLAWQQAPENRQAAAIAHDVFVDIAVTRGFRAGQQYLVEKISAAIGTGSGKGHLYRDIQTAVYKDII
jgi:hypothetical protein